MHQNNTSLIMYTTEDGIKKNQATFDNDTVWAKFAYTASDGKTYQVDYYNLDVGR